MDEDWLSSFCSDVEENQSVAPFWLSEDVLDEDGASTQPLQPSPTEVDQSVRQSRAFSLTWIIDDDKSSPRCHLWQTQSSVHSS